MEHAKTFSFCQTIIFLAKFPTQWANNHLTGELPSSLKNCTKLTLIDLAKNKFSEKIQAWVGESLSDLAVLNLRSNGFNGRIPSSLCQLKMLQILDLSRNNISGARPRYFNNFTAMTQKGPPVTVYDYSAITKPSSRGYESLGIYFDSTSLFWKGGEAEDKNILGQMRSIDLSSNRVLNGEIPEEITELLELVSLNLSRNNLTGVITPTFGQLKSLDVLHLSRNQLFGQIPTNLSQIYRLSFLDLSKTNLSSKIPSGTQLQSFNASACMGNPQLCGYPLLKECSRDDEEQYPPSSDSNGDIIHCDEDGPCFYASIALGFITGFWGVCGDAQQYMEIFLFSILHQTKRLAPCDNISEYCQIAEESSKINGNRSLFITELPYLSCWYSAAFYCFPITIISVLILFR